MSNVRPQSRMPRSSRSRGHSCSRESASLKALRPMSRLWQHCSSRGLGLRRASAARSARAVRPASLAASARASVFQGFGGLPGSRRRGNVGAASRSGIAGLGRARLIGRSVSRNVVAVRPSPNPNTSAKSPHAVVERPAFRAVPSFRSASSLCQLVPPVIVAGLTIPSSGLPSAAAHVQR